MLLLLLLLLLLCLYGEAWWCYCCFCCCCGGVKFSFFLSFCLSKLFSLLFFPFLFFFPLKHASFLCFFPVDSLCAYFAHVRPKHTLFEQKIFLSSYDWCPEGSRGHHAFLRLTGPAVIDQREQTESPRGREHAETRQRCGVAAQANDRIHLWQCEHLFFFREFYNLFLCVRRKTGCWPHPGAPSSPFAFSLSAAK